MPRKTSLKSIGYEEQTLPFCTIFSQPLGAIDISLSRDEKH